MLNYSSDIVANGAQRAAPPHHCPRFQPTAVRAAFVATARIVGRLSFRSRRSTIDRRHHHQSINQQFNIHNKQIRPAEASPKTINRTTKSTRWPGPGLAGTLSRDKQKKKERLSEGASPRVFWYSPDGTSIYLRASREAVRATEQAEREAQASSALARKQSGEASSASKQAVSQSVSQCISASPDPYIITNHEQGLRDYI